MEHCSTLLSIHESAWMDAGFGKQVAIVSVLSGGVVESGIILFLPERKWARGGGDGSAIASRAQTTGGECASVA